MARKSRKNLPQPEQAAASMLLPELEEAKMPAAIYVEHWRDQSRLANWES